MDIVDVFAKVIKNETNKINRNDESILWHFLSSYFGEDNVLTEILWDENGNGLKYFGCAVRIDGVWKVYNLIGTGGVVVSIGKRAHLAMKVG